MPAQRQGAGVRAAVQALLAGPTAPERARGVRTALPSWTPVRGVTVDRRIVTVDLGARFAASTRSRPPTPGGPARPHGLVGRRRRRGSHPDRGWQAGRPVPRDRRAPAAEAGRRCRGGRPSVRDLPAPARRPRVHGRGGSQRARRTSAPRLRCSPSRSGRGSRATACSRGATVGALERATRPVPARREGPGRRIEVLLDRQLALLIENDRVDRIVHISTGAPGRSTPIGSFHVTRKERYSWSVPFKVWMPWASYFTGGIAFHEYRACRPIPHPTAAYASTATTQWRCTGSRSRGRR